MSPGINGDPLFRADIMRDLKAASGLTWKEIAERGGLSTSYLQELANGSISDPSTGALALIARGLDVSPLILLGYTDDDAWQAGFQEGIFRSHEALSKLSKRRPEEPS